MLSPLSHMFPVREMLPLSFTDARRARPEPRSGRSCRIESQAEAMEPAPSAHTVAAAHKAAATSRCLERLWKCGRLGDMTASGALRIQLRRPEEQLARQRREPRTTTCTIEA